MGQVEKSNRGARRKIRTREKLMAASRKLLSEKGLDEVSIQDITEEADVGLGSFYNHFESKMAVLKAIADEYFVSYALDLDQLVAELSDPVEKVCVSYRFTMWEALTTQNLPIWQQLPSAFFFDRIAQRATNDLEAGMKTGHFKVDNPDVLLRFIWSGLLGIGGFYAQGEISKEDADHTAIYYLRLLGVEEKEAIALATKPLPKPKRRAS